MNTIFYLLLTLFRALVTNPGRLIPLLAVACVVTLVIAVITDAMVRRQSAKKTPTGKTKSALH